MLSACSFICFCFEYCFPSHKSLHPQLGAAEPCSHLRLPINHCQQNLCPITLAPLIPAMPRSRYLCCVDQHWEEWWDQDECPIAAQHKVSSTESFCPNPLLLHGFIFRKEGNSLARVSFPFLERSTWSESYAFVGVNELCFCTCSPVGCNGMWRDFPLNLGSPHQSILEVPTGPEQQQHWYNTSFIQLPRNLLGFISDWQADFPNLWTA